MSDARLKIVVEALNLASGELKRLEKDLEGVKKGSEGAKNPLTAFKDTVSSMSGELLAGGAVLVGFAAGLKQVFDAGKEGAALKQTGESFQFLMQHIGAAPDQLDKLRQAARGTVDDLTLMKATTTLLAGAQGPLATALANSTPQLLEIAKAANKLNPTLGDTTFLYESLALGIKRGSPLILDNLGLTIKIGDANKRFADSIGKTVDQLTEEEQKQALLNETLRAGGVLIEQAGGNVDSATDTFTRFEATTTNLTNKLKEGLLPYVVDVVDAFTLLLTASDKVDAAYTEHSGNVEKTSQTYEEYIAELSRAAEANGFMVDAQGNLVKEQQEGRGVTHSLVLENYALTEGIFKALKATENYGLSLDETAKAINRSKILTQEEAAALELNAQKTAQAETAKLKLKQANENLAAGLSGTLANATSEYNATVADTQTQLADARAELEKYQTLNGQVVRVTDEAKFSQAELTVQAQKLAEAQAALAENTDPEKQAALTVAVEKSSAKMAEMNGAMGGSRDVTLDYSTKIGEAQSKIDELTAKEEAAAAALKRTTLEFIYQKAAADLDAGAALELARGFGLIDEKSYNTSKNIMDLKNKFDLNKNGMIDAGKEAELYTAEIQKLADAALRVPGDIQVRVHTSYSSSGRPSPALGDIGLPGGDTGVYNPTPTDNGGGGAGVPGGLAVGGPAYGGQMYQLHSDEMVVMPQNGYVLNRHDALQAATNNFGGVTFNFGHVSDPEQIIALFEKVMMGKTTRADNRRQLR